jgi:hypothetical protein
VVEPPHGQNRLHGALHGAGAPECKIVRSLTDAIRGRVQGRGGARPREAGGGEATSGAIEECGIARRTHDPGVVLTYLAVAIADGADCLTDIAALREEAEHFGLVASTPTTWRAVEATAAVELREIPTAMAHARAMVWSTLPRGARWCSASMPRSCGLTHLAGCGPDYKHGFV